MVRYGGIVACYLGAFILASLGGYARSWREAWSYLLLAVGFLGLGTALGGWRVLFRGRPHG